MNDKVEYKQFHKEYKKWHKRVKCPRTKADEIWLRLRKDHNLIGEKWTKHKSVAKWPVAFHRAAKQEMVSWRLASQRQAVHAQSMFFGLFNRDSSARSSQNASSASSQSAPPPSASSPSAAPSPAPIANRRRNRSKEELDASDSEASINSLIEPPPHKRQRVESASNEATTVSNNQRVHEWIMKYDQFQKFLKISDTFPLFSEWRETDEGTELKCMLQSTAFYELLNEIKSLRPANATFYALIIESDLNFDEFDALRIYMDSHEYHAMQKALAYNLCDVIPLVTKNALFQHKHLNGCSCNICRALCVIVELYYIRKMAPIFKCWQANKLETNYNRKRKYQTQSDLIEIINGIDAKLASLALSRTARAEQKRQALGKERDESMKRLLRLQAMVVNSRRYRDRQKERWNELEEEHGIKIVKQTVGRRRCEDLPGNENLIQCMQTVVDTSAKMNAKRRSKTLLAMNSTRAMHIQMMDAGMQLSRSSTYRRFQPAKVTTHYARKYHTKCIDAKLGRMRNDGHKDHISKRFSLAMKRYYEQLLSCLGDEQTVCLSLDDKDRIKLGVTPINKQQKIVVSVEQRTVCPDHDFVVGSNYKIIPSVVKILQTLDNLVGAEEAVSKDGETYIFLRSGKHDTATATAHYDDMVHVFEDRSVSAVRDKNGNVKPVLLGHVDGGPDENTRYIKTIICLSLLFIKYQFDALIFTMTAPGSSCYNEAERVMAHINRWINGMIFDCFQLGNPHKPGDQPDDIDLERANFEQAMIDMVNIMQQQTINGYAVYAKHHKPPKQAGDRDERVLTALFQHFRTGKDFYRWLIKHTRFSQLGVEFVSCLRSCKDCKTCSESPRSDYFKFMRPSPCYPFAPIMVPTHHSESGLVSCTPYKAIPANAHYSSFLAASMFSIIAPTHDIYNPLFKKTDVFDRTCPKCMYYHPSKTMRNKHIAQNWCGLHEKEVNAVNLAIPALFDCIEPSKDIQRILLHRNHKNSTLFLAEYTDDEKEWVHLPATNEMVVQYLKKNKVEMDLPDVGIPVIATKDIPFWLGWHINQYEQIGNDLFSEDITKRVSAAREQRQQLIQEKYIGRQIERVADVEYDGDSYSSDESSDDGLGIMEMTRVQKELKALCPNLKKKSKQQKSKAATAKKSKAATAKKSKTVKAAKKSTTKKTHSNTMEPSDDSSDDSSDDGVGIMDIGKAAKKSKAKSTKKSEGDQ